MKKILIYIVLILLSSNWLLAKTINVNYKASFGILGTIATIDNKIIIKKDTYEIDTRLKFKGFAKLLLGTQQEHYVSKGFIKNGFFVSYYYYAMSQKDNRNKLNEYFIDHKTKSITKRRRKWKKGKLYYDKKKDLNFYAKDDLLTLYFNMDKHIKAHKNQKNFILNVAGLEKQKGKVKITVATAKDKQKYKNDLGSSASWYAKALIVQKNFKHKKGDILLSVSKDGYIKKAVIKDLVMYGDAVLKRVESRR